MHDGGNSLTRAYLIIFMKTVHFCILLFSLALSGKLFSQRSYHDSIKSYVDTYIKTHEVVTGDDKKFLHFFPIDEQYRVVANFEKPGDGKWFSMETSGRLKKMYRVYGKLSFTIHDTLVSLDLYQSQSLLTDPKYKDYLALMFTDKTTGTESYDAGRYIDLSVSDIKNNKVTIDFNKAYNPYCAYVKGQYNCPIPPRENELPVAIKAGEKSFGKKVD